MRSGIFTAMILAGFWATPSVAAPYSFTTFDVPAANAGRTYGYGINNNGVVAGYYRDGVGAHGFTNDGGVVTSINVPGANAGSTNALGVNDSG